MGKEKNKNKNIASGDEWFFFFAGWAFCFFNAECGVDMLQNTGGQVIIYLNRIFAYNVFYTMYFRYF